MDSIILSLITSLLDSSGEFIDSLITSIVPIALYAEDNMGTIFGRKGFDNLFEIAFGFGISLIVLKFLKKIFDFYVTWLDGDPSEEPFTLLTNFLRAVVVAIGSPFIYTWIASIVEEATDLMLTAIGMDMSFDLSALIMTVASAGLLTGILVLVYIIIFFLIYIQFLMRGLEMLILRIGMPIACTGLMDSDKGVFGGYMKKFIQSAITIIVQLCLFKLSLALMLTFHPLWGIAGISLALKTPKFLQEFMILSGGTTSVSGMYHGIQTASMVKQAVTKMVKTAG